MQQNVDRNAKKLAKIHEFLNDSVDNRCQLQSGMEAEILNVKKIFLIIFWKIYFKIPNFDIGSRSKYQTGNLQRIILPVSKLVQIQNRARFRIRPVSKLGQFQNWVSFRIGPLSKLVQFQNWASFKIQIPSNLALPPNSDPLFRTRLVLLARYTQEYLKLYSRANSRETTIFWLKKMKL